MRRWVEIEPRNFRPAEVECLLGDASKARARVGWRHRVTFDELEKEMVDADIAQLQGRHAPRPSAAGGNRLRCAA